MVTLVARLVESHERHLRLARENGALRERLVGLEHELRRLRGTPEAAQLVLEADAGNRGLVVAHPERWRRAAADPRKDPRGCAPRPPLVSARPMVAAPAGPVPTPMMAGPAVPGWPGGCRSGEPRDGSEMVVHLWVIVTTPVSDGRRRGPASSPPAEVVGEPEHTTAGSDAYVLELALTVIAVITAWSIMAAWWALR